MKNQKTKNQTIDTDKSSRPRSDKIFSLIAIFGGVLLSLAAIEFASRTMLDDGMNFDLEMWKYAREIKRVSPIEGLGHDHTPNTRGTYMGASVAINSLGYRDREYALEKPKGAVRILMIGDSVTFGWGVELEDTVAKKLEVRLNRPESPYPVEVINTGVGNYNTVMEVKEFIERGSKLKPDIVVLNYFINDAEPTPRRRDLSLLEYFHSATFVMGRVDRLQRLYFGKGDWRNYYSGLYDEDSVNWLETKSAIKRLVQYCLENDIKIIIANYPELHEFTPYPFQHVTDKLKLLTQSLGVPFVDLLPAVATLEPSNLWVSPTDAHPNRRATEVFAAVLEKVLRTSPVALLPRQPELAQ